MQIGYKTFDSGSAAAKYFYTLINSVTQGQELNEYEFHNVVELLKAGHPEAERKLRGSTAVAADADAPSVRAIVVRPHAAEGSPCFHLVRTDGSSEDFSTKKCVCALFPAYAAQQAAKPPRPASNNDKNKHNGGGGKHGGGGQRSGGRGGGGGNNNSRGGEAGEEAAAGAAVAAAAAREKIKCPVNRRKNKRTKDEEIEAHFSFAVRRRDKLLLSLPSGERILLSLYLTWIQQAQFSPCSVSRLRWWP